MLFKSPFKSLLVFWLGKKLINRHQRKNRMARASRPYSRSHTGSMR